MLKYVKIYIEEQTFLWMLKLLIPRLLSKKLFYSIIMLQ